METDSFCHILRNFLLNYLLDLMISYVRIACIWKSTWPCNSFRVQGHYLNLSSKNYEENWGGLLKWQFSMHLSTWNICLGILDHPFWTNPNLSNKWCQILDRDCSQQSPKILMEELLSHVLKSCQFLSCDKLEIYMVDEINCFPCWIYNFSTCHLYSG